MQTGQNTTRNATTYKASMQCGLTIGMLVILELEGTRLNTSISNNHFIIQEWISVAAKQGSIKTKPQHTTVENANLHDIKNET